MTVNLYTVFLLNRFFFQNNTKNLDLSYKLDLDLWDYLGRITLYHFNFGYCIGLCPIE